MFVYEKDNKINVVFDGTLPVETPDMVVYKDENGAHIDFLNATPSYETVPQESQDGQE